MDREVSRKSASHYQDRIIKELDSLPDKPFRLFTEFDDLMIQKYYPTKGGKALAKILGKTERQVISRAGLIGVKRQ